VFDVLGCIIGTLF